MQGSNSALSSGMKFSPSKWSWLSLINLLNSLREAMGCGVLQGVVGYQELFCPFFKPTNRPPQQTNKQQQFCPCQVVKWDDIFYFTSSNAADKKMKIKLNLESNIGIRDSNFNNSWTRYNTQSGIFRVLHNAFFVCCKNVKNDFMLDKLFETCHDGLWSRERGQQRQTKSRTKPFNRLMFGRSSKLYRWNVWLDYYCLGLIMCFIHNFKSLFYS